MRKRIKPGLPVLLLVLAIPAAWFPGCNPRATPPSKGKNLKIGTPVTNHDQIAAWDIAIPPSGEGLPDGEGTAYEGRRIFEFGPTGFLPTHPDGQPTPQALSGPCFGGPRQVRSLPRRSRGRH